MAEVWQLVRRLSFYSLKLFPIAVFLVVGLILAFLSEKRWWKYLIAIGAAILLVLAQLGLSILAAIASTLASLTALVLTSAAGVLYYRFYRDPRMF